MMSAIWQDADSLSLLLRPPHIYKRTKPIRNHVCTRWVAESSANYLWTVRHGKALCLQYTLRYKKRHASLDVLRLLSKPPPWVPDGELTPFAQAMPEDIRVEGDAVAAYRRYYHEKKAGFAVWKQGRLPYWADPAVFTRHAAVIGDNTPI